MDDEAIACETTKMSKLTSSAHYTGDYRRYPSTVIHRAIPRRYIDYIFPGSAVDDRPLVGLTLAHHARLGEQKDGRSNEKELVVARQSGLRSRSRSWATLVLCWVKIRSVRSRM
eukprot:2030436-Amphidinium_carterae.3